MTLYWTLDWSLNGTPHGLDGELDDVATFDRLLLSVFVFVLVLALKEQGPLQ